MALSADDRLDIHEVVARYGHVVDDEAWDQFHRVFSDDAVVDFSTPGSATRGLAPIVGLDEIVRVYRDVMVHPLQHVVANSVLDIVSDDEVVARCKGLFPIPGHRLFEAVYTDTVVRTPVGWRIRHKTVKTFDVEPSPWRNAAKERMAARGGELV
jgi:hypothetical protein